MKHVNRAVAVAAFAVAVLCLAGPASAAEQTKTFRYPVTVKGYQVRQAMTLADHPHIDGFITGMSAEIVDKDGTPVPIQRLMLHHIVFSKLFERDPQCGAFQGFDASAPKYPGFARRFFGAGEERNKLRLPPGYGLRMKADDRWLMTWMLMNHRKRTDQAFIEWKVTYDTNPGLKAVHPYWLDARNCNSDPVFNVPGGGRTGSTYSKGYQFRLPESGRIVAVGGHVHGGARNLVLSQPACGDRTIARLQPAWGMPDHPFYHVRPILHEPGPIAVSQYATAQGWPVAKGQPLRLTANYDDQRPHTRVMGIALVYVAPSSGPVNGCGPPPADAISFMPAQRPFRTSPPRFTVPIVGIGRDGKARDISKPPGRTVRLKSGGKIRVRSFYFSRPNVVVKRGARLNWSISGLGADLHNVTLASGPRGFGSPNRSSGRFSYRFHKRGKYRIFCALHPVSMTEVVTVR